MAIYLDRKYTLLVSGRLRNFAQKDRDLFNFSCPFCGDSKKNARKARGYLLARDNDYFYFCHNCNQGTNFYGLLKFLDTSLHKQYVMEKFQNRAKKVVETVEGEEHHEPVSPQIVEKLDSIDTLPDEHYAKAYIMLRKIPEKFWSEIYYTDKFKDFMDKSFPGHGKDDIPNDARILLPYTNFNGDFTLIAGRALESGDKTIRYVVVKVRDEQKGFGLHRLSKDFNEPVYITEGQFDSLFLPNACASGDSNLLGLADYLRNKGYTNITLVFDSEPRNKDLVKIIEKAVRANHKVTLIPYTDRVKDLNDMVMFGIGLDGVKAIVDKNTYQGLTAQLKLAQWRKV